MKFYIRQQCAAAVLRVMEAAATTGVVARLQNIRRVDTARLLFPKLVAMNLDQPEAQLFFGHQNKLTCTYCRRRKGRSAFRASTPQSGIMVRRLYDIANGPDSPFRDMSRDQLKRWGLNYTRKCCLPSVCRNLFVRIPGRDDVFLCLDFRDTLHGMVMFLLREIMEGIDNIPFSPTQRRCLDSRLALLGTNRYFRDPLGNLYRRQRSIFSDVGMTAHDKVQLLFYLPHVFGPVADGTLPDPRFHLPLMTALARAQLVVIAARGLRCYTKSELVNIFDRGYIEIFGSLQHVCQLSYQFRLQRHLRAPRQYKRPSDPVERPDKDPAESDTCDTDDEANLGGFRYSHGSLCLVHQHWVLQVVTAGGFNVNCTQSSEAAHKTSAKLASLRVRHLHGMKTVHSMLTYLCSHTVFEHLKDFFPDPPSTGPACPIVYGVKLPLSNDLLMDGRDSFTTTAFQSGFLHKEIPVARSEFMDMLCDQFDMPKTVATYRSFERLSFKFGQKFTCSSGLHFWATDTQYTFPNIFNKRVRRDRFFVDGVVRKTYRLADGRRVERLNALCAEASCFVTVSNLSRIQIPGLDPDHPSANTELQGAVRNDSVTFFLVRWFEAHEHSFQRDQLKRPICPGPLDINHCVWRYAKTQSPRQSVPPHRPATERYAYYGLIFPENVVGLVNIAPIFVNNTINTGDDWLQTVTLI